MYKILKDSYGKINGKHSRLKAGEVLILDKETAARLVAIGNAVEHKPHPKVEKLETKTLMQKVKGLFNGN